MLPFPFVLLLLPSPDPVAALDILTRRLHEDRLRTSAEAAAGDLFREINRSFVEDPSNPRLATHTVITAGRTPEQTSAEIAALIRGS